VTVERPVLLMIGQTVSHYPVLEKLDGDPSVASKRKTPRSAARMALEFLPEELAVGQRALEPFQCGARAAIARAG